MAQHKPTPEEQLLKLIENPEAAKSAPGNASKGEGAVKQALKTRPAFSFSKIAGIFDYWKAHWTKTQSAQSLHESLRTESYIRSFNFFLIAGIMAAAIYLILDLTVLKEDQEQFLSSVSTQDSLYPIRNEKKEISAVPDLDHYHEMIERRNPFLSPLAAPTPAESEEKPKAAVEGPAPNKVTEKAGKLNLVGISWSADNPLAMIEDTESGKTFFLRAGQEINGLKVQEIQKEKVIVTYEGEEAALF